MWPVHIFANINAFNEQHQHNGTKDLIVIPRASETIHSHVDLSRCSYQDYLIGMTELSPGTRVQYLRRRQGIVRFNGNTHFEPGLWIGVEFDDASGKNDGSVEGRRYFHCPKRHGMFVRPETLSKTLQQPLSATSEKMEEGTLDANSGGIARKRQSLIRSGPSRSTNGPRSSVLVGRQVQSIRNYADRDCSRQRTPLRKWQRSKISEVGSRHLGQRHLRPLREHPIQALNLD